MIRRLALILVSGTLLTALFLLPSCSSRPVAPTPTALSLAVSCDTTALGAIGQQGRCHARVTLSDGTVQDPSSPIQWASSDPAKVTVSTAGVITAVAPGIADISAAASGLTGRQSISVTAACSFTVSPASLAFPSGGGSQAATLTATPALCSPNEWTASSSGAGLTVSPSAGSGSATITITAGANAGAEQTVTATIAGQTVTATIAASPPPPPTHVLSLTLTQGEHLSGPYAATVTGPNGFVCTLGARDAQVSCPQARFEDGQTVVLLVTLTVGVPGDTPIRSGIGCDAITSSTCRIVMNGDRSVTIAVGCAICDPPVVELVEERRPDLVGPTFRSGVCGRRPNTVGRAPSSRGMAVALRPTCIHDVFAGFRDSPTPVPIDIR